MKDDLPGAQIAEVMQMAHRNLLRGAVVTSAVLAALALPQLAASQYDVIKWEQPPVWGQPPVDVYYGWNEISWTRVGPPQVGPIVADDWVCTTRDPVVDVHWWGSYLGWSEREAPIDARPSYYHITIWTDVPKVAGDPMSFSHPGMVLWEYDCYDYTEEFVGYDYDPRAMTLETCFYYTCVLPEPAWFHQQPGENIYWVSIAAAYDCPCDGDLNGDGVIDQSDQAWFYLNCPPGTAPVGACAAADLNCDGFIDQADESILDCLVVTGDPLLCCPPPVDPPLLWGWKTRPRDAVNAAPDAAVLIGDPTDVHVGMTYIDGWPITWPGMYPEDQWDMAFELSAQRALPEYKVYDPPVIEPISPYPDCYWGWDEPVLYGGEQVGAADWICLDQRPVSDIHWWGSYRGWDDPTSPPPIKPVRWIFTIWDSDPLQVPAAPRQVIWEHRASAVDVYETVVGCDFHPDHGYDTTFYYTYELPMGYWFYQPGNQGQFWLSIMPEYEVSFCDCNADLNGDGVINGADEAILLSCQGSGGPMCQAADLNCDGIVDTADRIVFNCQRDVGWADPACCNAMIDCPWGWKTKPYADFLAPGPGMLIFDPTAPIVGSVALAMTPLIDLQGSWWDFAFALTTPSEEVEPYIKWSQPPTPWEGPTIIGWDEYSVYGQGRIAADDWVCDRPTPVTDLHWWGSFLGWSFPEPPRMPDRFVVTIWTDVPAGVDHTWSHPGVVIHQFEVVDPQWTFVGFNFDPCGQFAPDACFRFDYNLPREAWFWQPEDVGIYWISIAAEYDTGVDLFPFGWKTRPRDLGSPAPDAAVSIWEPTAPVIGMPFLYGQPLSCATGVAGAFDLSFVLTTCDLCGDMNGDGLTDTYDIDAFVLALSDPAAYALAYPGVDIMNGDCNDDGYVDTYDIDSFVFALVHGGCQP